jgi:hypothetical protein
VEGLLEARLSSTVILAMVRNDCVTFRIDETARERLMAAGATEEFLDGLAEVCYRGPEPEPAVPERPERERAPAGGLTPSLPFSPGSAALRSLVVPGLGQFYTGRPVMGVAFLAAWAGAIGFGVMSQEVTVECLARTSGSCPSGEVRGELVDRPMLPVGLGAALAVAVISAFEARSGANKANAMQVSLGSGPQKTQPTLELLPPWSRAGRDHTPSLGLVLLQLRHR